MKKSNFLRVCTHSEIKSIDRRAKEEFGISEEILMENAGRAASQILLEKFSDAGIATEILVLAGTGNNGGDALVVARRLIGLDRRVRIFTLGESQNRSESNKKNLEILKKMKAKVFVIDQASDLSEFFSKNSGPFTVVDGLIGTGLREIMDGLYFDVVQLVESIIPREVISLDIPSGVSSDSGAVLGAAFNAQLTISFGFPKLGHFFAPGAALRGELINVDISLPPIFAKEGNLSLLQRAPLTPLLAERDRYGHKNSFGHTLIFGGSPGRLGAIEMAARSCHKMGTGLVTVCSWPDSMSHLYARLPSETMAFAIHLDGLEADQYRKNLASYDGIVVGPGLGLRSEGKALLEEILTLYQGPIVLDADALNLVSDHRLLPLLQARRAPTVLTPHLGEMARLLGQSKESVQADPLACLLEAVKLTHAIVLLKGAATLISSPDGHVFLNHYPNDGMATAGSGDVLAGMIGGLLAQKMDPLNATLMGVYLHSLAGDWAAQSQGHRSMTAIDIIDNIGKAFREIQTPQDRVSSDISVPGRTRLL